MSGENLSRVRVVDAQRRQAMIEADTIVLSNLFSDDLSWVHSSGVIQGKDEMLAAISDRLVVYETLEISADQVREYGAAFVHFGNLSGRASRGDQKKTLSARFLSVWCEVSGQLQMVAWQSTNFNT